MRCVDIEARAIWRYDVCQPVHGLHSFEKLAQNTGTAITIICDWYLGNVVKDASGVGILFTPIDKCFKSTRPVGGIWGYCRCTSLLRNVRSWNCYLNLIKRPGNQWRKSFLLNPVLLWCAGSCHVYADEEQRISLKGGSSVNSSSSPLVIVLDLWLMMFYVLFCRVERVGKNKNLLAARLLVPILLCIPRVLSSGNPSNWPSKAHGSSPMDDLIAGGVPAVMNSYVEGEGICLCVNGEEDCAWKDQSRQRRRPREVRVWCLHRIVINMEGWARRKSVDTLTGLKKIVSGFICNRIH